jgi:hypothetical protein
MPGCQTLRLLVFQSCVCQEAVTATHMMKLTKHFTMMTNHAPYIPKVALLIIEKPRWYRTPGSPQR